MTNNTSITDSRLKHFVELLRETASSSDLNSFMDTLKDMIDASKRDKIEKVIKKVEEEQKKQAKNIKNKESEMESRRAERRKEKAKLEQEAERKGDENMAEKAMNDESKKLYKLDRIKLVRIFQQKILDSGSVKSFKKKLHGRKSLPIKKGKPDDGRLDSNEMIDYILYHNYIKPFHQKHKVRLDFPAQPSRSGIHPSHHIAFTNKRQMRGRGLDFEFLNKDSFDVDNVYFEKSDSKNSKTKEPNFGKYVVNLNLLNKGILAIRKPSGAHVYEFK